MPKIRLIVEHYGTVQVSEDRWRDGTIYKTVEVEAPDWLVEGMVAVKENIRMRVIGAEVLAQEILHA